MKADQPEPATLTEFPPPHGKAVGGGRCAVARLAHGVQMVVCGQSAMAQHYDFKNIVHARANFSASVTFINRMTRGYIKINE